MWASLQFLARLLPGALVTRLCTCGPVGYWGRAPGTNGTAVGLILYTVLFFPLGDAGQFILAALLALLAVLLCDEGERRLQKHDPGEMILDEIVAVPVCFLGLKAQMAGTGAIWVFMLAGFALFRLFDIAKPFGIRRLQRLRGGLGVVIDDLAAAVAVNVVLRLGLLGWQLLRG